MTVQPRTDDLATCRTCRELSRWKTCQAAESGLMAMAIRRYQPDPDRPRRCEAYQPNDQDPDPRTGLERWPGLKHPGMRGLEPWQPPNPNPSTP